MTNEPLPLDVEQYLAEVGRRIGSLTYEAESLKKETIELNGKLQEAEHIIEVLQHQNEQAKYHFDYVNRVWAAMTFLVFWLGILLSLIRV
jgi:FtsZ-binding cell division protein ZapB